MIIFKMKIYILYSFLASIVSAGLQSKAQKYCNSYKRSI